MEDLGSIHRKVQKYKSILENTIAYRKEWNEGLRDRIVNTLVTISKETDIEAEIEVQDKVENMELIVFNLGRTKSGISEKVDLTLRKPMFKSNGALIYQQLFNGKVLVLISLPFIEGYGEPRPPKTLEILRPHELTEPFILRHMETFLQDITEWEDYDDDLPQQAAHFNPIGFQTKVSLDGDADQEL